jgi:hypothetical protein
MHQALTGFQSITDPWEQLSFQLSGPHSIVVFPVRAFFLPRPIDALATCPLVGLGIS